MSAARSFARIGGIDFTNTSAAWFVASAEFQKPWVEWKITFICLSVCARRIVSLTSCAS